MRAHLQAFCCVALLFCVAGYAQSVGNITTVAGTGTAGFTGDGGLSISAKVYYPYGVGVDKAGYFYSTSRIRTAIASVRSTSPTM